MMQLRTLYDLLVAGIEPRIVGGGGFELSSSGDIPNDVLTLAKAHKDDLMTLLAEWPSAQWDPDRAETEVSSTIAKVAEGHEPGIYNAELFHQFDLCLGFAWSTENLSLVQRLCALYREEDRRARIARAIVRGSENAKKNEAKKRAIQKRKQGTRA